MINSIKECFFKLCLFISSSSKEQNDLQKRIDKAAALQFEASVEYISNTAKNRFQLSKKIALLERQIGFFDKFFLKDRITTLIQTAENLRTTLQENKKRSINEIEINEVFSQISTDLFTYEVDLPPLAVTIEPADEIENVITEEEETPLEKDLAPFNKIQDEELTHHEEAQAQEIPEEVFTEISTDLSPDEIPLPPSPESIKPAEEIENEVLEKASSKEDSTPSTEIQDEEPQDAALTSEISLEIAPSEGTSEPVIFTPIPDPIVKPEKAVFNALIVPGILSHPYRLFQAFVSLPNFQYYNDKLIRFIQSYKFSTTEEKDFQENFDWILKAWKDLVAKSPEFYEARTYPLSEYVNTTGAQYYILKAIDSFNAFIENYSSFPLFSKEGRTQFCAVDVEKIAEHIFDDLPSEADLTPAEQLIVQLGKGFLSLVDDLFQKCQKDAYWKKWAIAFTRAPWNYLSIQTIINVLKDPLLLKGALKQLLLEFSSLDGYLQNLRVEGQDLYKKTKNLSGETTSKDEREFQEACVTYSALYSDEGQTFFRQVEFNYDMYIAQVISKFIDVHDVSYLSDFVTKILTAVPSFRAALESPDQYKDFQHQLKGIFISGMKALQNFMRESEQIPLERLVLESLDRTLTTFRFKASDLNYLQQYWDGLALPWLQDIAKRVKDYPKDWGFFPKEIPFNKDFLNQQTAPGHMRNNATLFHFLDKHNNVNVIIDKLSGLLGKYVNTPSKEFKTLFNHLRNSWRIYSQQVYGALEELPNFTAKAFSPADRIKERDVSNQYTGSLYTLEIFYRTYKALPFLSKDNLKVFAELNAERFVDSLFNKKELDENASSFEKQLFHPLKDLIFWIRFRVIENRNEPGWINYEINSFESKLKDWLDLFGGSFAVKTFLLAKTFEKTAKGAFAVVKSFMQKDLFNLTSVKKQKHLKKEKHKNHPEIAQKKYESEVGKKFNALLDTVKNSVFSPLFDQWLDNHSISSLMKCMNTWLDAFEEYSNFVKTGKLPEFNKVIRNTLVITIKTLQNYLHETQENDVESTVVQCLHECFEAYTPATGFNFHENHFQQITSKFWQKLLAK